MIAKMDEPLAEVFSPVKFGDYAWAAFDPVNDIFAITQSAGCRRRLSRIMAQMAVCCLGASQSVPAARHHSRPELLPRRTTTPGR
jgi:hypothetical protein